MQKVIEPHWTSSHSNQFHRISVQFPAIKFGSQTNLAQKSSLARGVHLQAFREEVKNPSWLKLCWTATNMLGNVGIVANDWKYDWKELAFWYKPQQPQPQPQPQPQQQPRRQQQQREHTHKKANKHMTQSSHSVLCTYGSDVIFNGYSKAPILYCRMSPEWW